jgi:hypothetical protein
MDRRRLVAMGLGGLVLLVGATVRRARERPVYALVGVASTGDTVWLDVNQHAGEFWGGRINGPTAAGVAPGFRIDCARHVADGSPRKAARELARAIADTACAHWR